MVDRIGDHLNDAGEFVSDLYVIIDPATGRRCTNVVPIKISARTARLLWLIVHRYEGDRPVFAADVKQAIENAGFSVADDGGGIDADGRIIEGFAYILVTDTGVYTKAGKFFESQGGLTAKWGAGWERIDAASIAAARRRGIVIRRERFPTAHKVFDE